MSLKRVPGWILVILLVLSVVSCAPSYYEKEEIGEALAELIPASIPLNEIYFGEGLPLAEEEDRIKKYYDYCEIGEMASDYYPVSESCPYKTIEEIKEDTLKVYSDAYCEYLFTMAFSGISDVFFEGTESEVRQTASYARYLELSGIITQRVVEDEEYIEINRTYDVEDFDIVINREEYVVVKVQSYIDGEKDQRVEVKLIPEEDGWRLDSPTY